MDLAQLAIILNSKQSRTRKVAALKEGAEKNPRVLVELARMRVAQEPDPRIQATLVSVLGHYGDASDGPLIIARLDSGDARVIANALDSVAKLHLEVPAETFSRMLHSADARVLASALSLQARTDPAAVLERIEQLITGADARMRLSLVYVLGQLCEHEAARRLLLALLEQESERRVLDRIAAALLRAVPRRHVPSLVGPLEVVRLAADAEKRALLDGLLRDLAVGLGWVEEDVRKQVERYLAERPVAPVETPVGLAEPEPPPPPEPPVEQPRDNPAISKSILASDLGLPASFSALWGGIHQTLKLLRPPQLRRKARHAPVAPEASGAPVHLALISATLFGVGLIFLLPRGQQPVANAVASRAAPARAARVPPRSMTGGRAKLNGRVKARSSEGALVLSGGQMFLVETADWGPGRMVKDVEVEFRSQRGSLTHVAVRAP